MREPHDAARRPLGRRLALAGAACLVMFCGCMTERSNLSRPGRIDQQQRRAVRFDPYPNQDIAPEIVGGRPRDYQQDRSQAERSSLLREAFWGVHP